MRNNNLNGRAFRNSIQCNRFICSFHILRGYELSSEHKKELLPESQWPERSGGYYWPCTNSILSTHRHTCDRFGNVAIAAWHAVADVDVNYSLIVFWSKLVIVSNQERRQNCGCLPAAPNRLLERRFIDTISLTSITRRPVVLLDLVLCGFALWTNVIGRYEMWLDH